MKKQTKSNWQNILFCAIAVNAILFIALGCKLTDKFTNQNLEQEIIGRWETTVNKRSSGFEFKADKTMSFFENDFPLYDGTYRIIDENTIEIKMNFKDAKPEKFTVKIEGDKMTIRFPQGEAHYYRK